VSAFDFPTLLEDLLSRVAGTEGALVLDEQGFPIAQAGRAARVNLEAAGAEASLLLRETMAASERLGHGGVTEILVETERARLAMIPLKNNCCLCLLMGPESMVGRGLFEARRTACVLDQSL